MLFTNANICVYKSLYSQGVTALKYQNNR